MALISVIVRRLDYGNYLQFGYCGPDCSFESFGSKLINRFSSKEAVDYIFSFGQFYLHEDFSKIADVVPLHEAVEKTGSAFVLGRDYHDITTRAFLIDRVIFMTRTKDGITYNTIL